MSEQDRINTVFPDMPQADRARPVACKCGWAGRVENMVWMNNLRLAGRGLLMMSFLLDTLSFRGLVGVCPRCLNNFPHLAENRK